MISPVYQVVRSDPGYLTVLEVPEGKKRRWKLRYMVKKSRELKC